MDVRFKYLIYAPMSEYSEWPAMMKWSLSHEYGGMLNGVRLSDGHLARIPHGSVWSQ